MKQKSARTKQRHSRTSRNRTTSRQTNSPETTAEKEKRNGHRKGNYRGGTRPATLLLESIAEANSSESEMPRIFNQITRKEFVLYTENMSRKLSLGRERGERRGKRAPWRGRRTKIIHLFLRQRIESRRFRPLR